MNTSKQDAGVAETRATVVWLERLAYRCRIHGYVEYVTLLRTVADILNDSLLGESHVDPEADECLIPVRPEPQCDFFAEVNKLCTARSILPQRHLLPGVSYWSGLRQYTTSHLRRI